MLDTQLHTTHNMDTREKHKVLCLHPVKVVNPRIAEFILTHDATFFSSQGSVHKFAEPSFGSCTSTKQYKKSLMHRVRKLLRHDESIECFYDKEGDSVDAFIYVPCNHCIVCLHRKSVAFSSKCSMECQQHQYLPLFITLTYSDENLPPFGLRYSDVQLFFKRLRINLQRKYNFSDKLRFAACGEYGSHTNRPHYHILLWNFPRDGHFSNFFNIDDFIRSCWKLGLTQTKQCRDSMAGLYVGKYMSKQSDTLDGLVPPMKRTSICLGLDFVKSVSEPVLRNNPSQLSIKYCDRFDGSVKDLPLITYYVNKLFPTFSSLSTDVRNSLRDITLSNNLDLLGNILSPMSIDLLNINPYKFSRYMSDTLCLNDFDLSLAIYHLSQFADKVIPDFLDNERVKSYHHAMLFYNLSDVDPQQLAYTLAKKRAIQIDKEVF